MVDAGPLDSSLPAAWHVVVILVSAMALHASRRGLPAWSAPVAGALVLLPCAGLVLSPSLDLLVFGKEGVLEAATEGVLVALVVVALGRRVWWMAALACLLLLEEVDYGQIFLDFATPEWVGRVPGTWTPQLNFHNLPGAWLVWRVLPTAGLLWLWRRGVFGPGTGLGVGLAALLSLPTIWLAGGEDWNESIELAQVAVVWVCWRERAEPIPPNGAT